MSDRLERYLQTVLVLAYRDIKVRYKRAFLGILWSLIVPLSLAGVLILVFGRFFHPSIPNYPLFILSVIFPWRFFQTAVMNANGSFLASSGIIRCISFPRSAVPAAAVISEFFHFAAAMVLLVVALPLLGGVLGGNLLAILPLTILLLLMALGLGLILAPLQTVFRDMKFILDLIFLIGFYATPVFYSVEIAPPWARPLLLHHPISTAVLPFRVVLYEGRIPSLSSFVLMAAYAVLFIVIGLAVNRAVSPSVADHV